MVVFSYTVSDFGIPKVIGGNFNVLAVDIFKQVIGQQNFNKGAVVGLILLVPVRARVRRRLDHAGPHPGAVLGARGALCAASASRWFDRAMFVVLPRSWRRSCSAVLGMAVYTSFIKFWPYDKSMSLRHYTFGLVDAGVDRLVLQQPQMAILTAVFGTMFIFMVAYLLEKTRGMPMLKSVVRLLATIPMAVPGHGARAGLHPVLQRARPIR